MRISPTSITASFSCDCKVCISFGIQCASFDLTKHTMQSALDPWGRWGNFFGLLAHKLADCSVPAARAVLRLKATFKARSTVKQVWSSYYDACLMHSKALRSSFARFSRECCWTRGPFCCTRFWARDKRTSLRHGLPSLTCAVL